ARAVHPPDGAPARRGPRERGHRGRGRPAAALSPRRPQGAKGPPENEVRAPAATRENGAFRLLCRKSFEGAPVSGSGVRKDLGILRDRPFTLLLIARTMAMLGTAFGPVAIAFGVLGLPGATATTLSAVLTAEALPMVAFTLVGGVIADRLPRHRVIAVSETANALAYAGLAASLFTGWTPLPLLMALSAVTGISVALIHPALTGIIPDVVPPERLQTANALLGFGVNSARVAGAVLGGAAVALLGAPAALAASGATFAVAAVLVTLLGRTLPKGARDGGSSMLADLREGWHEFFSRQWLWVVVAQYSIVVLALQAANGVLGPLLARDEL